MQTSKLEKQQEDIFHVKLDLINQGSIEENHIAPAASEELNFPVYNIPNWTGDVESCRKTEQAEMTREMYNVLDMPTFVEQEWSTIVEKTGENRYKTEESELDLLRKAQGRHGASQEQDMLDPSSYMFQFYNEYRQQQLDMLTLNQTLQQKTKEKARKYPCTVCDKRFTRPSTLKTHMNSHTGNRPFACNVAGCGWRFTVFSNLKRHARICPYANRLYCGAGGNNYKKNECGDEELVLDVLGLMKGDHTTQ